jgi:hypothetical protein
LRQAEGVLMKKPCTNSGKPASWSVFILRAKLTWMGSVEARDEAEAQEKALKQLDIRPADQFRISIKRE